MARGRGGTSEAPTTMIRTRGESLLTESPIMRGLLLTCTLFLGACGPPVPTAPGHVEHASLAHGVPAEVMRAAIIEVLNRRRHQVIGEEHGLIYTRLGRGRSLDLAIAYDETSFRLDYVDSRGFELGSDPATGAPLLDARYTGWMRQLKTLIELEVRDSREEWLDQEREREELEHERSLAVQRAGAPQVTAPQVTMHGEGMSPGGGAPQPPPAPAPALRPGFTVTRPPNHLGAATLVIVNRSAEPLHRIALRSSRSRTWRPNQLQRTLVVGGVYTVHGIRPGSWELRVEDLAAYKEWHDLRFEGGGEYTLVVTSEGWYRR